ncbi:MAG: glycosyltransferase family 1 protein [Cyanobacteria bacterium J06555_13]
MRAPLEEETMLKVTYDYQIFCWQRYGGISRYFYELARRVSTAPDFAVQILAGAYMNEYLKQCPSGLVKGLSVPRIPKGQKVLGRVNEVMSEWMLKSQSPDVVHETFYAAKSLAPAGAKVVTTIHDMLPEKFPQYFAKYGVSDVKKRCVERADHILCVSKNTQKDLIELFDVDPDKTSVTYHGSSFQYCDRPISSEHQPATPYLLYVGGRGGHKNFGALLEAYARSTQLNEACNIVCFGGDILSEKEQALLAQRGIAADKLMRITGGDEVLIDLYKGAIAFVYPSLYEGFGIPLIEAMSLRCPVVCSDSSCFPEVAANAAEYFPPDNVDSLVQALEAVTFSQQRREQLIAAGTERVKQFSWDTCALQTQKVYQQVMS